MLARAKVILPLLSQALRLIKQIIGEDRVFYPIGLGLDANGNVLITGGLYDDRTPDLRESYEKLQKKISTEIAMGKFVAIAIAVDASVPEGHSPKYQDAIRVYVEAPGYAMYFYYPYRRDLSSLARPAKPLKCKIVFGDSFTVEAASKYFQPGLVLGDDARTLETSITPRLH